MKKLICVLLSLLLVFIEYSYVQTEKKPEVAERNRVDTVKSIQNAQYSDKAKEEKQLGNPNESSKEEDQKPMAIGGKFKYTEEVTAKKKFPWLIVAGAIVVAGIIIYILTRPKYGNIQINSTPQGAEIYFDGIDQKKITPSKLTNIIPGTYTVKLIKEGYKNYEKSVSVTAGETTTINAALNQNTITITRPSNGESWEKAFEFEIKWTTDSTLNKKMNEVDTPPLIQLKAMETSPNYTISLVNIDLYKNGSIARNIVSNQTNSGSYKWMIPSDLEEGTDYNVRISCSTESSIFGESASFQISHPHGSISITSNPTGAMIGLDGANIGLWTNCVINSVDVGNHTLKLELDKYANWIRSVDVRAHETTTVSATLLKVAKLIVVTSPNPCYPSSDGYWYFTLTVRELNGVGVTLTNMTYSEGDLTWSMQLPWSYIYPNSYETEYYRNRGVSNNTTGIFNIYGIDNNGNTGMWSGSIIYKYSSSKNINISGPRGIEAVNKSGFIKK